MNNMVLTLLDKSDALVSENKLKCFNKYGMSAGYTDMFLLTGGISDINKMSRITDEFGLKNRTASYAFNTLEKNGNVFIIDESGKKSSIESSNNTFGVRPTIMTFDDIFSSVTNNNKDLFEIELGEYPQYAASHMINVALEDEYSYYFVDNQYIGSTLIPTGKSYTVVQNGNLVTYPEYYYGGNRYVRMVVSCNDSVILSNGNTVYNGEAVWVKVSPVKWFVDYKNERFISKFVLLSGLYPDLRMFDFFSKYMKDDILFESLTRERLISMICRKFNTLEECSQVEFVENMPDGFDNLNKLTIEELKGLLDEMTLKDFGYSKRLSRYYF